MPEIRSYRSPKKKKQQNQEKREEGRQRSESASTLDAKLPARFARAAAFVLLSFGSVSFLGFFWFVAKVAIVHGKMKKKVAIILWKIQPNMLLHQRAVFFQWLNFATWQKEKRKKGLVAQSRHISRNVFEVAIITPYVLACCQSVYIGSSRTFNSSL